jgi:hypothetical protein
MGKGSRKVKGERMVSARSKIQALSREAATLDSLGLRPGLSPRSAIFKQARAESASHEYACLSFTPGLPIEDVAGHFFRAFSAGPIIARFRRATP